MLIDLRFYTCQPGLLPEFMALAERELVPLETRHLGQLVFYSASETGTVNQAVHAWAFKDTADRDARQRALEADPAWPDLAKRVYALVQHRENRLLYTTRFSPLK